MTGARVPVLARTPVQKQEPGLVQVHRLQKVHRPVPQQRHQEPRRLAVQQHLHPPRPIHRATHPLRPMHRPRRKQVPPTTSRKPLVLSQASTPTPPAQSRSAASRRATMGSATATKQLPAVPALKTMPKTLLARRATAAKASAKIPGQVLTKSLPQLTPRE